MTDYVDLAAPRLGGMVLDASDEFFAPKERLLDPGPPVFDPDAFTERGKLMDGWETRRRRGAGEHDWCVVRLGVPGVLREVVVDTAFFRGNYPESFALHGCCIDGDPAHPDAVTWTSLVERTSLSPDAEQVFRMPQAVLVTHVRLVTYPDGGVARLRLRGEPLPDLRPVGDEVLDLAATLNGGLATACSDMFFSSRHHLVDAGDPVQMRDGWETRRRRGPGHDWAVVRLAAEGTVVRVEVDTTHFKGNAPERCSVEAAQGSDGDWREIVAPTPLRPHARHAFRVAEGDPVTHVRLNVFPDGGVARLRVVGRITDEGWRQWGVRRLDALPAGPAAEELRACCAAPSWIQGMLDRRPFADFDALLDVADAVWWSLGRDDWLEAFAAHPRIGEGGRSAWSRQEQSGAAGAPDDTLAVLADGNRAYERRFGHVFLICATGLSAEQMLAALRDRLGNDPETELRVAAEEQRKITRLRVEKAMKP